MKKITRILVSTVLLLVTLNIVFWSLVAQPTVQKNGASSETVSAEKLRVHVVMLSQTFHPRDWTHPDNLKRCADYIATHFTNAGAVVESQQIEFHGKSYQNIIGRFNKGQGPRVIVGAHYDGYGETPGADDNASGVAALIELAYLLGRVSPACEVELVAYVNEEPPFYRTELMGSALHAKRVKKNEVKGVIVLEMVGCFKDDSGSQHYPSGLLQLWYPGTGNFIGVVGSSNQGVWIKRVKAGMKGATGLPVYSIRAPAFLPGVDFSDHASYWPYNIPAVMVTDTAFFRNQAYHTLEDTADTLDYERLAKVVVSVSAAVVSM